MLHAFRSWASEARNAPVIIVMAFAVVLIIGLGLFVFNRPAPCDDYTVVSGDTVSGIVWKFLPEDGDPDMYEAELIRLNRLATNQVHAGQTLQIPAC